MPTVPLPLSIAHLAPGIYVDEVDPGSSEIPAITSETARAALDQLCQQKLARFVFEENRYQTWKRIVQNIQDILATLWIKDTPLGRTAREAFFIRCDMSTTSEALRYGTLICLVGMALVKPSEFVTFRICIRFAPRP